MFSDNDIKIKIAKPEEVVKEVWAVRKQVFVKEMGLSEKIDREKDGSSVHILAYIKKRHRILPVGTMRIQSFADFAMFERMAVTRNFRKTNVAEAIMQYGFNYAGIRGYRKIRAACKEELLPRWQRLGFYVLEKADKIKENGMELLPICRNLPPHPRALTIDSPFALLLAHDEEWSVKLEKEQKPSKSNIIRTKLMELKEKCFGR